MRRSLVLIAVCWSSPSSPAPAASTPTTRAARDDRQGHHGQRRRRRRPARARPRASGCAPRCSSRSTARWSSAHHGQALHAHARAGAGRRRRRRLGAARARPLARGQHDQPHLARASAASRSTRTWADRSATSAPPCAGSSPASSATWSASPRDATVEPRERRGRPEAVRGRPARAHRPPAPRASSAPLLDSGDRARRCKVRTKVVKPKVTTAELADEVSGGPDRQPRRLQADALQEPQAGQDLRDRRRPGRPGDARGALQHPEQGGEPGLDVPNSDWVGAQAAARSSPAARPENPLKARWLGHLRRRGHPRHRRRGLDRHRRLARLHPHAHPRRDRALRPGAGGRAGLHRLGGARADLLDRRPPPNPAAAGRRGGPCGEAQGADVHAAIRLRMTAYHMVDASRVPWIRMPRARRRRRRDAATPASTSWRPVAT